MAAIMQQDQGRHASRTKCWQKSYGCGMRMQKTASIVVLLSQLSDASTIAEYVATSSMLSVQSLFPDDTLVKQHSGALASLAKPLCMVQMTTRQNTRTMMARQYLGDPSRPSLQPTLLSSKLYHVSAQMLYIHLMTILI
jgi:hypothetical protein